MPVLDAAQRAAAAAALMADLSQNRETVTLLKADVQAAVSATDDWIVNNLANYNTTLPLAARNGLTTAQKAKLLMWVIRRRVDVGA